jgi:hypothetical protein
MKTTLSLGLIVAAASTLFACSDEGTGDRTTGTGGTQTGNAGTGGTGAGTAGTGAGTAGTGTGGAAGTGTGPATGRRGAPLVTDADGNVVDSAGASGINGAAINVSSPMNPAVTFTHPVGSFCIAGSTAIVTGTPPDYTNLWGTEIDMDLNRGNNPDAVADAGADAGDAGALLTTALPWDPKDGNVIGISFKLVGNNPAAIGGQAGVPAAVRFKTAPTGGNTSTDNFCNTLVPTNGGTHDILFSQLTRDCWTPGGPGVLDMPYPAGFTGELQNVGWQVNASEMIAYQFDFCVTEIAPIFAN